MAITVNTNVTAMGAQRNLNKSSNALATSMERLSTGSRINSAKDDAAGLQISNRLNSQVRGMGVAMKNAQDGISLAQTAEGALDESTNILQRMRDLSVQAGNDTNSTADRTAIKAEIDELSDELTKITERTKFGGGALLDGQFTSKVFQIGANSGETITISIATLNAAALSVNAITVESNGAVSVGLAKIDAAIASVDTERSKLGSFQNRMDSTINNLANIRENTAAGMSRIKDVDFAQETVNLTKQQILQQAGTSILAQAKQIPQAALSLLG
ncbi:flagellin [Oceanimonas sp. CHS3-5]|uniref:flagellin N-terminal helical domain-containing protein n=1 Tax=Oceanimonas sp. CHS3-5 TaxID=3068186 RepID=UPI00273CFF90|nr:flagellin [Oceanimonas sp. CHS3-5]MDP5290695.1 flagellin [Oceanimonas sp. CHS3-5]